MNRFTLRKEYFGGILHDTKEITCHVLSPAEFNIIHRIISGEDIWGTIARILHCDAYADFECGTTHEMGEKIKKFMDIGILVADKNHCDGYSYPGDIRYVEPPEVIPQHCLTAPIRIYHTYTRQCNLRCSQCCVNSKEDYVEQRMTLEQIELVMRKFYEAGTMEWRFTGGEPTSCADFPVALKIAKSLGMAIMLNTNGCWSEELMESLPEAGIGEIIVSLEGREEINDKRRSPGVYKNVLRVLNRIYQHNQDRPNEKVRVTVNMTIAKDNIEDVEFVVRLASSFGFNTNFVPLRPYGRTLAGLAKDMLSTEEFMRFSEKVQRLRELPEIRDSGGRIIHRNMDLFCPDYPDKSSLPYPFDYSDCGALSTGFGLCPDGRVNACSFLMSDPEFLGPNLVDVSAREAWLHPRMEFFRRATKVRCTNCRFYKKQCEGKCRAMVLANKGDIVDGRLVGYDPYCFSSLMKK